MKALLDDEPFAPVTSPFLLWSQQVSELWSPSLLDQTSAPELSRFRVGRGREAVSSEKPSDPGLICLPLVIELAGGDARLPGCESQLVPLRKEVELLCVSVPQCPSSAVKWREQ